MRLYILPTRWQSLIHQILNLFSKKKSNKGVYEDYRTVGIGAQILNDIGVRKMNLMSAPKKYHGINAFGLEVAKHVTKWYGNFK